MMTQPFRAPRLRIPPPAPHWRYGKQNGFFGLPILQECDGALGLALWRAARAVWLFVEADADRGRPGHAGGRMRCLFTPDEANALRSAGLDPETFARALAGSAPAARWEVGAACAAVSEWAGQGWKPETRLHFAELAAKADQESPVRANAAGRACRDASLAERAAVWFERGFRLAVRSGNRSEAVRALLGYGALMKECGRLNEASRWFLRAARRAARTGRRRRAAETRHDLMALAAELGDVCAVVEHAEAAVELYPLRHHRFPYLAHDFAFALVRKQQYAQAFPLLEAFVRAVPARCLLPGIATFAWAAAGCGQVHRFEDAERRALGLIAADEQSAAASLIFLAEGARLLGRWGRAERHAGEAIRVAARLGQSRYEADARALLAAIHDRTRSAPAEPVVLADLHPLTREFTIRLRRWKPGARPDGRWDDGTGGHLALGNGA